MLDGSTIVGFSPVYLGAASIPVTLGAGVHSLTARYTSLDEVRSTGSTSDATAGTVVVKTDVGGSMGSTVPATLALTLGAPATFGAFVPGVDRDYTASTSATVLSTAGDAALTVSDPGHLMNGTFALPSALQVAFSKSSWNGPTSQRAGHDRLHARRIGATDALRTGAYSKTLTFTLDHHDPVS